MRWALVLGFVSGCASGNVRMRPAAAPPSACDSDAYVLFVRPLRGGGYVEIREADGTFLGQLENESYFGVAVAPGEHFFVAKSSHEDSRPVALKADVGAGETYYVDVEMGKGKAKKQAMLFALAPRMPYWKELHGWLASARRFEVDPSKGPAPVPPDWTATYSYAFHWWATLNDQAVSERKIILSDGESTPPTLADLSPRSCASRPSLPSAPLATKVALDVTKDKDVVKCWTDTPTGTKMRTQVCKTDRELEEESQSAWDFLIQPRPRPFGE